MLSPLPDVAIITVTDISKMQDMSCAKSPGHVVLCFFTRQPVLHVRTRVMT